MTVKVPSDIGARWARRLSGLVLFGLLAASCTTVTTIDATEAQRAANAYAADTELAEVAASGDYERHIIGSFTESSCDFASIDGLDTEPECGWLTTPIVGSTHQVDIELPVMIFRATGPTPKPDPIVYLHGGPAAGLIEYVDEYLYDLKVAPFIEERDVVLFDQRGSGLARPDLRCEPANNFFSDPSQDTELEFIERRARTCAWRITIEGVNLADFSASRSADDVRVLARELGYEQINIVGTSWGGFLATTIMKQHPRIVRSAILNSPLSLEVDLAGSMPGSFAEAIEALNATCERDDACVGRYGNIVDLFGEVVEQLDATPQQVLLYSGSEFGPPTFQLPFDGELLAHLVFGLLYSPDAIASIPDLLVDLRQGDMRLAERFSSQFGWGWGFDFGFLTYMCNDVVPHSSPDAVRSQQTGVVAYDVVDDPPDGRGVTGGLLCEAMKVETEGVEAPDSNLELIAAPALIFSGELDPITSYSSGESLARALPDAQFVGFADLTHGALGDECADRIAADFIDDPSAAVDASCSTGRPNFLFADAALSIHAPNLSPSIETAGMTIGGATTLVDVPAGYERSDDSAGSIWWRGDAPVDITGIGILVADIGIDVDAELDDMIQRLAASQVDDDRVVNLGGAQWVRRSFLGPVGIGQISWVRADGGVAVFVQAYADEIIELEPIAEQTAASIGNAGPA